MPDADRKTRLLTLKKVVCAQKPAVESLINTWQEEVDCETQEDENYSNTDS